MTETSKQVAVATNFKASLGMLPSISLRVDQARVLISVFDEEPKIVETLWTKYTDKGRELGLVCVKLGHGDEGTQEVRVLDVDGQDRPQKWWKVDKYARAEGMQAVPINWDGPAAEIPEKYKKVQPDKPNRVVLVRLADSGPWAKMELQPADPPETRGAE